MNKMKYDYYKTNSDETLIFLHGWGLTGNHFNKIINKLGGKKSYIKIDFYGFGQSEMPKDYFDTYEYAYHIFLLLKKLNVSNKIILVGHSFGGRVAIILGGLFNLNIGSLVLTSSAGINKFSFKNFIKIKMYKCLKLLNKIKLLPAMFLSKFGSDDYKNCNEILRKVFVKVVRQDLRYMLNRINVTVYLFWDKKDKTTPYYICKKIICCVKQYKIILTKNGGHFACFYNINKFSELLLKI